MRLVIASLALLAVPTVSQQLQWVQSPVNGHWYAATASELTWHQAELHAVSLGGHLATIRSQAENDWAATTFDWLVTPPHDVLWIGLNDETFEGQYEWASGEPFDYENFGTLNDSGCHDFIWLFDASAGPDAGTWVDGDCTAAFTGLIEVVSGDCDADAVPDVVEQALGGTDPCLPLAAESTTISVATGGEQEFILDAGPTPLVNFYLLVGSLSGTSPGLPVDGLLLPLNWDDYLLYTVLYPNSTIPGNASLVNTFGVLTTQGAPTAAKVAFVQPAGFGSALIGQTLHHAYVVLTIAPSGSPIVSFVSNAVPLSILP